MAKKVGTLIKEARTAAGLSQEQLARKIKGLSAAELGKAERGETELTQAFLKEIAKATGVTQASLLNAAKGSTAAKKTETAKKTTAKKTTAKKTETAKKTDTELTAAEKKLIEAYRAASADAKKNALKLLKGEDLEFADIMKLLKLDSKLDSL
ncbi:MAG: helix-turn-helix transcriptional regulator, partial [Oscillospiraceae bacterium]|nr:helix-turn-helix transcriptional regulator [Oscillospiraceae bacterium]